MTSYLALQAQKQFILEAWSAGLPEQTSREMVDLNVQAMGCALMMGELPALCLATIAVAEAYLLMRDLEQCRRYSEMYGWRIMILNLQLADGLRPRPTHRRKG